MSKRVFVSYSSPDVAKADAIREALETAGISCWIAPRDLSAGTQWGAGIVQAIQGCEAVVVVFSAAANNSPQVAREMELAVSNRRPLIPIRVANDMPTEDMQYFLGVSHWFNAFAQPIQNYLPDIVTSVRNVLAKERSPWASLARRMPQTRSGQLIWAGAGALAIALIVGWMSRPSFPTGMPDSPMTGRWQAEIADASGKKADCILDVQTNGVAAYSDSCPPPITDARGQIGAMGTNGSKNSGTFGLMGNLSGYSGTFKKGWFGGMTTTDNKLGEIHWSSISSDGPVKSGMDDIIKQPTDWPLADVPGIARRARAYIRSKWKPDAELTEITVKLLKSNEAGITNIKSTAGGLELKFSFYSPSTQEGLWFEPFSQAGSMFPMGVINRDGRGSLPDNFLDLPKAVEMLKAHGMRAKQVYNAELEDWGRGSSAGGLRLDGVMWMIDSQLDERFSVRAAQ